MRQLGLILFLLLSPVANAAYFNILSGDDENGPDGRVELIFDDQSATQTYAGPALLVSDGHSGPPIYNNSYFSNGSDIYYTPMGASLRIDFLSDVKVKFEWTSNMITNGTFAYSGGSSPMFSGVNGMLITSIAMGVSNIYFYGLAESIESSMSLKFTVYPAPVPLPAAFWLFLPSLLGLMGYRKISSYKAVKAG
ncbi:hypothetical protein [Methylophaga sp.]|uniref:hypothetical protein n=1 Tax=Methylophaga sp. TaxID=2024840 RepID=UPI002718644E|nr:hypothetical protein [Methylophaga sp.]MDO8826805.1 hypothetical protein [Methylophaga sp.]